MPSILSEAVADAIFDELCRQSRDGSQWVNGDTKDACLDGWFNLVAVAMVAVQLVRTYDEETD